MIEEFSKNIPPQFMDKSGSVFYSGRDAFSGQSDLYVLGLNPGGDPDSQHRETVRRHTKKVLRKKANWSEYRDESWEGKPKGTHGMQPRVRHLFKKLGLCPGRVPASNVIFLRSHGAENISKHINRYENDFWPFHQAVIEQIKPRIILCFGKEAGNFVKNKVGAREKTDEFVECNNRRWKSTAYANGQRLKVIVATHPSRADWSVPSTDPSDLVKRALQS